MHRFLIVTLGLFSVGCRSDFEAGSTATDSATSGTTDTNGSSTTGSTSSGTSSSTSTTQGSDSATSSTSSSGSSSGSTSGSTGGTGATTGPADPCEQGPFAVDFTVATPLVAGPNPQGVNLADIDNDGHLDVVNTSRDAHEISTHLGDGLGAFQTPIVDPIGGAQPFATRVQLGAIADDGIVDVVYIADALNPRAVQRRRGNADGTWGFTATYPDKPGDFALVDVNTDDRLDTVTISGTDLIIRLGDVQESFGEPTSVSTGVGGSRVATGDLDGDGNVDAAVLATGSISVMLGNGAGTFSQSSSLNLSGGAGGIAIGDVTGDGHQDVVATTLGGGTDGAHVFAGNGDASFQPPVKITVQQGPQEVVVADFDRDGVGDLGVTHSGGQIVVRLSEGNGDFARSIVKTCGNNLRQLVAGDLNEDCVPDLVTAYPTGGEICVLLSQ